MLYTQLFPGGEITSSILKCTFRATGYFVHPFTWSASQFLSLFLPTTAELEKPHIVIAYATLLFLPLFLAVIFTFPFFLIGMLVRMPLQSLRAPYIFSESWTPYTKARYYKRKPRDEYSVLTANVCLLPEYLARYNNLANGIKRATQIGQRIIVDQLLYDESHAKSKELPAHLTELLEKHRIFRKSVNFSANNNSQVIISVVTTDMVTSIKPHFNQLDFLCFQECWSTSIIKGLVRELHHLYPYVIYDIADYGCTTNMFCQNSGLMFASKYSIIDAGFRAFPTTKGRFDSKGLLMLKIQLNKNCAGYIFVTHLEAFQGKEDIALNQLDDILVWTHEFKVSSRRPYEVVLFDIICGDFNFDNMSPCDKKSQRHVIFDRYLDVARKYAGEDHSWTIGTVLRQQYLHDVEVSHPEAMRHTFQNLDTRSSYILDARLRHGTLHEIRKQEEEVDDDGKPVAHAFSGKRRTDYILCRNNIPLIVENFNFLTRLATLTDHVPVSMTFKVSP